MRELFNNKKFALHLLTGVIIVQVVLLIVQFVVLPNSSPYTGSNNNDSSMMPFFLFFVFIPSILLSRNKDKSGKNKQKLIWGLIALALGVLIAMAIVFLKNRINPY